MSFSPKERPFRGPLLVPLRKLLGFSWQKNHGGSGGEGRWSEGSGCSRGSLFLWGMGFVLIPTVLGVHCLGPGGEGERMQGEPGILDIGLPSPSVSLPKTRPRRPSLLAQAFSGQESSNRGKSKKRQASFGGSEGMAVVPPVYRDELPVVPQMAWASSQKRHLFIKTILPHIVRVNEHLLGLRARLLELDYKSRHRCPLSLAEREFLKRLGREYRVPSLSVPLLLHRVDAVPVSLVLAQAILESGYGTSSAARRKKSLFGHMETPQSVAAFETFSECVYSYARNLNRNAAYLSFQKMRHEMRQKGRPLCGIELAKGLLKYSVLGKTYVGKIQKLIRLYALHRYDGVRLADA